MNKNIIRKKKILPVLGLIMIFMCLTGFKDGETGFEKIPEHLKSATYYSDDWVVNFWNSESKNMTEELKQIADDGFNSIILVIPWREFQPDMANNSYNEYALSKLHKVMEEAEKQGLWVVLRVGYTWDYYGNDNVLERYQALLYDDSVKHAWRNYVSRIYQETSNYDNFYGGFLTWEDFWNFVDIAGSMGKGTDSIQMAQKIGYQDFAYEHYSEEQINSMYQTTNMQKNKMYLPERSQPAFKIFYEFYDEFLNIILADSQEVFPGISLEVRLDMDTVNGTDDGLVGVSHTGTYSCKNSAFTSLMYSVSMGQETNSQKITSDSAVRMMEHILAVTLQQNGGKPLYIDQLLYMDTTPGFEKNAQLAESERVRYLVESAPVLKSMTMGYGIWTYRNYSDNMVYNSQFALDDTGWKFTNSSIVTRNGSREARLENSKSVISQEFTNRSVTARKSNTRVRLKAESAEQGYLYVSIGGVRKEIPVYGKKSIDIVFPSQIAKEVSFSGNTEIYIDDINISTYEQDGQLYSIDGKEESCIDAVRYLNQTLDKDKNSDII